jgi:hypothetical protein
MHSNESDTVRRRLERLAWLLDSSITVPGTRFRIGLDPIIGLLPGLGDALGVLVSSYIVREAARLGAPPGVLARMAFNIALEGVVGIVPFVGDVFDAAWKANQRNVALLRGHLENPRRAARSGRVFVALLLIAIIAFFVLVTAAGWLAIRALIHAFGS